MKASSALVISGVGLTLLYWWMKDFLTISWSWSLDSQQDLKNNVLSSAYLKEKNTTSPLIQSTGIQGGALNVHSASDSTLINTLSDNSTDSSNVSGNVSNDATTGSNNVTLERLTNLANAMTDLSQEIHDVPLIQDNDLQDTFERWESHANEMLPSSVINSNRFTVIDISNGVLMILDDFWESFSDFDDLRSWIQAYKRSFNGEVPVLVFFDDEPDSLSAVLDLMFFFEDLNSELDNPVYQFFVFDRKKKQIRIDLSIFLKD